MDHESDEKQPRKSTKQMTLWKYAYFYQTHYALADLYFLRNELFFKFARPGRELKLGVFIIFYCVRISNT